jgi:hypothetical protein
VAERAKPRKIAIARGDEHRNLDDKATKREVINA